LADAERIEQRKIARGDTFAAHFAPGERLLLDQRDAPSRARQQDRGAGTRRARADDDGVIPMFHGRYLSAMNKWLNNLAARSSSFHPCGHNAESSPPRNPARTLSTASSRVTWLAPTSPTRWLMNSGKRVRLGSQAMKKSLRAASAPNSTAICFSSK